MSAGGSTAGVRIALLGGFAVGIDGQPVADRWRLRKAKTLVKLLCLADGHRLHRDAAIDVLWPEGEPAAAVNNLHQAVHAARRVLGPESIALVDDVLYLAADRSLSVDVDDFDHAAAQARASGDPDRLRGALALWTGPLLPEDAYEPWCALDRERLDELHGALVLQLATQLHDSGQAEAALMLLDPIAEQRPLDEPVQRLRVDALGALGRRWEAIAAYERFRDALEDEYGAQPDVATRGLYRRLLSGSAAPAGRAPHNFLEATTSFIGRQRELRELVASVDRTRLLTLAGAGGAGKSRLGLELARRVVATDDFPDGVWRVELAGVQDGDLVVATTADALGVSLVADQPAERALAAQLADRSLLLLLDNCEHVLAAVRSLVAELLSRCGDIRVVATSREPLGSVGELVFRVPSLELPPESDEGVDLASLGRLEAVQLLVARAQHSAASFQLDAGNATAVAEICRRLDGMPLALELAAARLAHLSVGDLAAGLDRALTLLVRRGGTPLDRQQTLAATLDWSYRLLDPDEQAAFRRLAVFAGGFSFAAAAAVCALDTTAAIDIVARLVDKSLVEADTGGKRTRYRLLEVVRQYADAELHATEDTAAIRRRHREWFAASAVAHDPDRGEPIVMEPSGWFDLERDNLRAALASALADDPQLALELAVSTWRFWMSRGLISEGERWLGRALAGSVDDTPVRARALAAAAVLQIRQGRIGQLNAFGDEICRILGTAHDAAERALGQHQRALLRFMSGAWDEAVADGLAQPAADDHGVPAIAASAMHLAGVVALSRSDPAMALERYAAAEAALQRVPAGTPPYFLALTLGWVPDMRAEPSMAYGEETVFFGRRVGAEQGLGYVAAARALAHRLAGSTDAALNLLDVATDRFASIGDRYGLAYAAAQRGHTLRWAGALDAADAALAESEQLRRELRDRRALALAISGRALVAGLAGDQQTARLRGREALRMMQRSGDIAGQALTGSNLGIVELMLGDPDAAVRLVSKHGLAPDVPGGHRAYGWLELLHARLLAEVGASEAAAASLAVAMQTFERIGDPGGLNAVQRACKAGVPSVATTAKS